MIWGHPLLGTGAPSILTNLHLHFLADQCRDTTRIFICRMSIHHVPLTNNHSSWLDHRVPFFLPNGDCHIHLSMLCIDFFFRNASIYLNPRSPGCVHVLLSTRCTVDRRCFSYSSQNTSIPRALACACAFASVTAMHSRVPGASTYGILCVYMCRFEPLSLLA
jgi:hypothetical protein